MEADGPEVFESAWNWDHCYPLAEPYDGAKLDGWTTLAALAQELADRAATFHDAGVDIIVWSVRGEIRPARLAPLTDAHR